jgi:hypothetical protein
MTDSAFLNLIINKIIIAVSFISLHYATNTVNTYALKVSTISRLGKT